MILLKYICIVMENLVGIWKYNFLILTYLRFKIKK